MASFIYFPKDEQRCGLTGITLLRFHIVSLGLGHPLLPNKIKTETKNTKAKTKIKTTKTKAKTIKIKTKLTKMKDAPGQEPQ